jgi:hypothetical protein
MGLRSLIVLVSLLSAVAFTGCSKDAQKIQPDTRGKRGENCQARNDCETGLACLNGICAKNEFNIDVIAKQCDRIECSADVDCCGDRLTEVPEKCVGREHICNEPIAAGCVAGGSCTDNTDCNGGTCPMGFCSGVGQANAMCETAADCKRDTCVGGICAISGYACTVATQTTDCVYYNTLPTCSTRSCNCQNPDYMPSEEICSDPECEDVCLLRCEESLCVTDKSCKKDADCLAVGLTSCDGGRCVECTTNKDCDVDADETCEKGLCHKPCKQNEECGLFEECQSGDCVYVGCTSDRECILAASRGSEVDPPTGGDAQTAIISGGDDPRLYKCLPSDIASDSDAGINTCKIPCENDGACGQFQVCDKGYCKFVGCKDDEECRAYLGIANQTTSELKPYVATAVCRE